MSINRDRWLTQVEILLGELPDLYLIHARNQEAERRAYWSAYTEATYEHKSITRIQDEAKSASSTFHLEVIKSQGEISAMERQLDILKFLIDHHE